MYSMVSSTGMLVNWESTSHETYSSSEIRGVWFLIIDANVWVSLILYLFSHKGFKYCELSNVTSKIHKTAGSIGFNKKAFYHEITPKFAQFQSNFINKNSKYKAEKSILLSHLNDHVCSLKSLCKKHHSLCTELKKLTGKFLYLVIINHINILK